MTPAERKVLAAALFLQSKASPITSRSLRHHANIAQARALDAIISLCASGHLSQITFQGPRSYRPEKDLLGAPINRGAFKVGGVTICPPAYAMGYGWPPERSARYSHGQD